MFLIFCLLCWLCIFIADSKQQKKAYYERQHQSYKTYERKEFNKKPFFIIVGIIVFLFLLGYSFRQGRITMREEMQQIAAEPKEEHAEEIAKLKEQYEQQIAELNNTIADKETEINNLNTKITNKDFEISELEKQLETKEPKEENTSDNTISTDEEVLRNELISKSPMNSVNGMTLDSTVVYNGHDSYYDSYSDFFEDCNLSVGKEKYDRGYRDIAGRGHRKIVSKPIIGNEYTLLYITPHPSRNEIPAVKDKIICVLSDGHYVYLVNAGSIENN